jgi:hypothetical protein
MRSSGLYGRINSWLDASIKYHYENGNDLELSWLLLTAHSYGNHVTRSSIASFSRIPSSLCLLLFGLLREKKILDFSLSNWNYRSLIRKSSPDSEFWIFMYEAVKRGWTKDKVIVKLIKNDDFFSSLLNSNVSFIEERFLSATRVDLRRRTFSTKELSVKTAAKTGLIRPVGDTPLDEVTAGADVLEVDLGEIDASPF